MRSYLVAAMLVVAMPICASAQALKGVKDDHITASFLRSAHPRTARAGSNTDGGGKLGSQSNGSVLGVDSLANWSSYFYRPGVDSFDFPQYTWQYTMVGHAPFSTGEDNEREGETTNIPAPIIPVNIDLRNADGSPRFANGVRLYADATRYVSPVLSSPIFSKTFYSSSNEPTQYTDAVQRAEFYNKSDSEWHTLLRPRVGPARTMVLLRGTYLFGTNPDGTLAFVLVDENTFVNALFPATPDDTSTVIGSAEHSGDIKTRDLATFLFPNTFLFAGDPSNCCVIGFHSYDVEPGAANNGFRERRYVLDYSSWITPGLFSGDFEDITALSHELAETFNDPFVNNATPWWLAPNGLCQNNLEVGDVIEGLPNAQFPISLNGTTWHPQNEALLQWFAGITPSNAINHAYSYPDTGVLTSPSVSQHAGCTAPLQ